MLRRLNAIAAELARLAGWMFFDARAYDLAGRCFEQALTIARDAGNHLFVANVLACMSLQATYEDDPHGALSLAQGAHDRALGLAAPRVAAMLSMRDAFARAALNDRAGCHSALVASQRSFECIRSSDRDPVWITYFTEAKLTADIGIAHARLGEWDAAEPLISAALRREEPSKLRTRAFHSFWLATVQLGQNEVEKACQTATDAVTLASTIGSQRIATHVRDFQSGLVPYARSRAAREYRARISDLMGDGRL